MSFVTVLTNPAVLTITSFFVLFLLLILKNYSRVQKNLKSIHAFLSSMEKKELSYRFKELDEFMSTNGWTDVAWEDFKKALIFPEKLYVATQNISGTGDVRPDIYLTLDASYFFNEESLVQSKVNYKFLQTLPTILTGLGPFFTFMKMALAFAHFSFSMEGDVSESLNGLMSNIQIAALCSVFAVGYSLIFMILDRIFYNRMCRLHCLAIQKEFVRLFDVISSEKFLIDLLKESKIQNITNEKLLKGIPEDFAKAVVKSLGETTIPYMENILYSLNKINESLAKNGGGDVVDNLF